MSDDNTPTKRERREAARAQRLERERAVAAGEARRRRVLRLGGLLAAAVVIVIVAVALSSGGGKKNAGSGGALKGVAETRALFQGIPQNGITLGDPTARVSVVEFADPQCPFCKDYTINELPSLIQKYVRAGKAKMELRYLTFIGPESLIAGRVLEAAGLQGKLWTASDLLYRNQGTENSGYVTQSFLTNVLKAAGADPARAFAQAGSPAVSSELGAAKTLAGRYGVDSTPTILVGPSGGKLTKDTESTPSAAGVGKMIDAALAKSGT
jgi:protein-disulfide isomerase